MAKGFPRAMTVAAKRTSSAVAGPVKQMPVQAATVAADLTAMKADFNSLLTKLKAAGMMANS